MNDFQEKLDRLMTGYPIGDYQVLLLTEVFGILASIGFMPDELLERLTDELFQHGKPQHGRFDDERRAIQLAIADYQYKATREITVQIPKAVGE